MDPPRHGEQRLLVSLERAGTAIRLELFNQIGKFHLVRPLGQQHEHIPALLDLLESRSQLLPAPAVLCPEPVIELGEHALETSMLLLLALR